MKILFIGFGAVAKCVSHVWTLVSDIKITKVLIIEPLEKIRGIDYPDWFPSHHAQIALTPENYKEILDTFNKSEYFSGFDLVIDLSVYVDGLAMLEWCQNNKILYINTAIEAWEDTEVWKNTNDNCPLLKICKENTENLDTLKKNTLQYQQNIAKEKYTNSGTTALLDMGQNPGCVSMYVLSALDFLKDKYDIKADSYGEIAMKLGLETIHISEYDSQITNLKASEDIFINTWSCIGFCEEASQPLEIGFGSHEEMLQTGVIYGNQLLLPKRSMNVFCESYEPMNGKLIGRLISHSENNTITNYLKHGEYKPSTYYVYKSSQVSQDSLEFLKKNEYIAQPKFKVLTCQEIESGYDSVGVLFLFKDKPSFWYGSIVTNEYACKINKNINATTLQVAAGILSGVEWILKNPKIGVCFPENIDTPQESLAKMKLLLGHLYCGEVPFKPKSNKLIDLIELKCDSIEDAKIARECRKSLEKNK